MMYSIFKIVHIVGFMSLFMALGALAFHGLNGGQKDSNNARVWIFATHGAALLVLFITGFGLLGVLKAMSFPFALWIWVKLIILILMGGLAALMQRKTQLSALFWIGLPLIGALAASMAILKPGG